MTMSAGRAVLRVCMLLAISAAMLVTPVGAERRPTVNIQLLNISDWHGQLDPLLAGNPQVSVGGAAVLAAYFQRDRLANPNTLTLTAGDAVGATPPVSSFFEDEPAIRAMRLMGVDADTLGNHNFDGGIARLQRQIDLAASTTEPGKPFNFVSSNLKNVNDNLRGVAPYKIFMVGGIPIGVIGMTNPEAPSLVFPGNFGTIEITDPVAAVKRARDAARDEGAKVLVVITHMGVTSIDPVTGVASGPLIDFANSIKGIDVVLGDHTDVQYSGIHNGALVTENKSKGLTYARVNLTVDGANRKVLSSSVQFVTPLASEVTPDSEIAALVAGYRNQLAPILSLGVGSSNAIVTRADSCGQSAGRTCESLVGDITTDALRSRYGTDFAVTNSGGLRAALTCPVVDLPTDFCPAFTGTPYPITRGQVLGVLPFGNVAVTLSINGAELRTILENGISRMPGVDGRYPQVSGLCFSYDISVAAGTRVTSAVRQAADGSCTGAAVDLTAASSYTIAMNDFMATGGDGYPIVISRATTREILDQVLADYIGANSPLSPTIQGRINCTTSGAVLCPVRLP